MCRDKLMLYRLPTQKSLPALLLPQSSQAPSRQAGEAFAAALPMIAISRAAGLGPCSSIHEPLRAVTTIASSPWAHRNWPYHKSRCIQR